MPYCYDIDRRRTTFMLCVTAMILLVTTTALFAPPVGPVDPFMADRSPKAIAFRDAWQVAVELERDLDPPPEGVTGEQQRKLVIEAFEKAIAIMPEAPPSPHLLLRTGQLWNSSSVAPEEPAKALEVYNKVRRDYPMNDRAVIQAIAGQSYALWLLKRSADAAYAVEKLLNYQLPDNASPDTVRLLHTLQTEMKPHLISYRAEAVGLEADNGEILLPGGQKLQDHLNEAARTLPDSISSPPNPKPSRVPVSQPTKSTLPAICNVSTDRPSESAMPLWAYVSAIAVMLGCVTIFFRVYRVRRKDKVMP